MRTIARTSWSDRQFRAGIDLVTSSAVNAIAGLGFWFVAARAFDESTVGVNATLISTMALVSNFATLGLKNALIRFIPDYGRRAKALVVRTYALTVGVTLLLAPAVAVVISARVDELDILHSFAGVVVFTLACAVWIVFVLQDSVLVALGETRIIPLENAAHAIAKLVLLIGLAFASWRWAIFAAWVAPVVVVVVAVNVLVMRRFAARTYTTDATGIAQRDLVRFAIGEHASTIVSMGLVGLLPLLVLTRLGEEASAFFAMAWTIAYNLMLANSNVSTAVLAEAAQDPSRLTIQAAKGIKQMSLFVIPGTVVLVIFAPLGLRLFGASYAAHATPLLRLLAIAAVIDIPVATAIAMLRATRQVGRLFVLYLVRTGLIGGLCVAFLQRFGLVGVGWGWLLGEALIAILLSVTVLRGVLIDLLPTRIVRLLGAVGGRARRMQARRRIRPLVRRLADSSHDFVVVAATNDATVVKTRQANEPVILKIAWTPDGAHRFRRDADHLEQLHRLSGLERWRSMVPVLKKHGSTDGHEWWSQSLLDGVTTLATDPARDRGAPSVRGASYLAQMTELTRASIAALHEATAHHIDTTDKATLERIVDEPFAAIAQARPKLRESLDEIAQTLRSEIASRLTVASWVHGDLAPGNVLFTPTGARVTGIVDWELTAESLPPEIDLAHFVLALVAESQHTEYGHVVAALVNDDLAILPDWAKDQLAEMPNRWSPSTNATVAWAHHLAANLAKTGRYRTNELWLSANVDAAVDALASQPAFTGR